MKSILIIITLLTSAILSYGQTPSAYDKILLAKNNRLDSIVKAQGEQISILVWSNTKMLAMLQAQDEILTVLHENVQANTDSIAVIKSSIMPFNKITYRDPMKWELVDPTKPNEFVNYIDMALLKKMLGLQ